MKELKFKKIDAFTKGMSSGNPAGYVWMDKEELLSEKEMQQLAAELKGFVNEVGFVNERDNRFELRYYSSECEVAFCGHATIGIMYDLVTTTPRLLNQKEFEIEVRAGVLSVFNHVQEDDAVYIMAPEPTFHQRDLAWEEILDAMDAEATTFDTKKPFQVIDAGLRTLILPMSSLNACLQLIPNLEKLKRFCLEKEFDIVHVFTEEVSTPGTCYRTRVFAPKYGYLEDPATGSGNSAFGYYLIHQGLWKDNFVIEQGPLLYSPNIVKMRRIQQESADRILFGGCATTKLKGSYCLHEV